LFLTHCNIIIIILGSRYNFQNIIHELDDQELTQLKLSGHILESK